MSEKKIALISCPICNKPVLWTEENLYRPFCSKRCQLIDLGEWVKGTYEISEDDEKKIDL